MNNRKAFNFYRSYFEVLDELNDKDKLEFLMALLEVQFTGKTRQLTGMAKFAYMSQKHSINAQIEGYLAKVGGSIPPSVGASVGASVQEKEQEQVKGEVKAKEQVVSLHKFNESFNIEFAKILNKKYEAGPMRGMQGIGQDVDSLVEHLQKMNMTDAQILEQAKSMRAFYDLKEWPMPTNYIKLLTALTENDWPQKMKDENPELKSQRIQKILKDANKREPEPDIIGSSRPGALG